MPIIPKGKRGNGALCWWKMDSQLGILTGLWYVCCAVKSTCVLKNLEGLSFQAHFLQANDAGYKSYSMSICGFLWPVNASPCVFTHVWYHSSLPAHVWPKTILESSFGSNSMLLFFKEPEPTKFTTVTKRNFCLHMGTFQ